MVTPSQKNGATITTELLGPHVSIANDGSRVIATAIQCFAGSGSCTGQRQNQGQPYAFSSTPSGWVTTPLAPSATQFPGANTQVFFNATAGTALFGVPTPPGGEDDWYERASDGSLLHLGPTTPPSAGPAGPNPYTQGVFGLTPDLSHLVWSSGIPQTFWPFDPSATGTAYEYVGHDNSQPQLVGVSGGPGSTDLISACETDLGAGANGVMPNALSENGSTVYFTAQACSSGTGVNAGTPVPVKTLYARIDGTLPSAHTVSISEPTATDCSACDTSAPASARFVTASSDGSKVFFLSTQPLLGTDTTTNLYEFDFDAPAGQRVTRLSAGDPTGANVQGVAAVSEDGSHAYFVAQGVLTGAPNTQGQTATSGADNLYVADTVSGQTSFITTLLASDNEADNNPQWSREPTNANTTPDGRFLVFLSSAQLTADDTSIGAAQQVFRYDAQTGQLSRLSIGDKGFNDNGNFITNCPAFLCPERAMTVLAGNGLLQYRGDPTMSDDGSRVFFMSPIALTPQALDRVPIDSSGHLAENVYEWEQAGVGACPLGETAGCVYLISDGRDIGESSSACLNSRLSYSSVCLLGTDISGENVFFTTSDGLAQQDTDNGQLDIYDARVGGGFPFTAPPPPCEGDNCKPPPVAVPPVQVPGSASFSGPGNHHAKPAHPKKCKKGKKGRKCRKHGHAGANHGGSK
jgi:hypothetical protein